MISGPPQEGIHPPGPWWRRLGLPHLRRSAPLLLLVVGMVGASQLSLRIRDARSADLRVVLSAIQSSEQVISAIKDAETGQRGFLLTGKPSYLAPYESGTRALEADLARLKRDIARQDKPELNGLIERIESLTAQKCSELKATIDLARAGKVAQAKGIVDGGQGQVLMDRIRSEVGRLQTIEYEAFKRHSRSSYLASAWSNRGILGMGLILAGILLYSEIKRGRSLEALARANARFQRLSEATQEGLVLIEDGKILDVNDAYARMFGYPVEELVGKVVTDLVDPDWRGGVVARHRAHVGTPYEVPCFRKDGSRFTVWSTSREITEGGRTTRISIVRDLTEEHAREDERQRLLDLLDASPDFIAVREVVLSEGGRLRSVYWNKAMFRLHGLDPGTPIPDMAIAADHPAWATLKIESMGLPYAAEHDIWVGETAYYDASGEEIPVSKQIFAMRNKEGAVTHYASVARDIRDQKLIEKAKRDFVSMSNHELRTPLTAMLGAIKLFGAGMGGSLNESGEGLIRIATSNGERLLRLLNELLDLDKLEEGSPMSVQCTVVDLDRVLHNAVELHREYARPMGVTFGLEAHAQGLLVLADEHRLMQVLGNLMSNAAKFSPRGSTVRIGVAREGTEVIVSVADQGPGIPDSFKSKIFQKFEQAEGTKKIFSGGSGLGLAITKLLVERMNGRIWFESEEGRGAVFHTALQAPS